MQQKKRLLKLFGIPSDEIIFEDFSCALKEGILKHGRIFVAENYFCFYATVLGLKTKKVIRISDITDIRKETSTLGLRNDVIEIVTKDRQSCSFFSFKSREAAFQLMYGIWKGEPINSLNASDESEEETSDVNQSDTSSDNVEQSDVEILVNADKSEESKELLRCNLLVTVDAFFEKFIGDNAIFSYGNHMEKQGATDIKVPEWKFNEELNCHTRECNLVIKLTGVPLRDKSRLQKIQTYSKEGEKLKISSTSKVFDVPYSGYFSTEERWEISPIEGSPEKSLLICQGWVSFNKSTMMKKMITQRNEQGLKEDYDIWIESVRKILSAQKKPEESSITQNSHQLEQVLTKQQLKNEKPSNALKAEQQTPAQNLSRPIQFLHSLKLLDGNQRPTVLLGLIAGILCLFLLTFFILLARIGTLEDKIDQISAILLQLQNQNVNISVQENKNEL